jgi:hypothetical protein
MSKQKKKWEIDRRTFLKGAMGGAGSLMGLPLLEAMLPSMARAALVNGYADQNFIAIFQPLGCVRHKWFPSQYLNGNIGTFTGSQWSLTPALSPLQAHKDLINLYAGIGAYIKGSDHHEEPKRFLTGIGQKVLDAKGHFTCNNHELDVSGFPGPNPGHYGKSMDQFIADRLNAAGSPFKTPVHSLQLASNWYPGCDAWNVISYKNATTPMFPSTNVQTVFDTIFFGYNPQASQSVADARTLRKKNVIDEVYTEVKSLMTKLGTNDRITMDRYLSSVESVQKNVNDLVYQSGGGGSCSVPPRPGSLSTNGTYVPAANHRKHIETMYDLIVVALECGRTRVASHMLGYSQGQYRWNDILTSAGDIPAYPNPDLVKYYLGLEYHQMSHHRSNPHPSLGNTPTTVDANANAHDTVSRWYAARVNYLVNKLKAAGLMDKTLIYFGGGLADADSHHPFSLPTMTIGKSEGMKTGMLQVFKKYALYEGYTASTAKLMVHIMKSFGVQGVETTNFGIRAATRYPAGGDTNYPAEDPNSAPRRVTLTPFT